MNVFLFPNAPAGPRPCGAFVLNLPQISVRKEPQLYTDVPAADQAAILKEVAYMTAAFEEAERSIDRLAELLKPYLVEVAR
ncbi:hypothetical protein [Bosea vaviloviae]|uniref:Uncharacterized protein n=1 Tax=Bosea vaviloviae TaxID=1526658 RepID=A0A0N0MBB2_9HYPH|nr:hypothetical protein [Bosea vaviloviae]KPH80679.1 hypothetical protein AE618_13150 [Bosea vaviloviae]